MSIAKGGVLIETLEEWEEHAGPKNPNHWQPDRSAMELARAWLQVDCTEYPPEVGAMLDSHPAFGPVLEWSAEPEVRLRFDRFRGEPRNTDLLVDARDGRGDYLIAVEGKADEPFGRLVDEVMAIAADRLAENPRSNGLARIEQLTAAIFGPRDDEEVARSHLRYQLLTAMAGALAGGIDAKVDRVVLLIQEFITKRTVDANHERNGRDLAYFVNRLSGEAGGRFATGQLLGPFRIPGRPLFDSYPDLYIGKVTRAFRPPRPGVSD